MPYFDTAQEWLTQSTLLLKARPSTTRITTKYNISHAPDSPHAPSATRSHSSHKPRPLKVKTDKTSASEPTTASTSSIPEPPRATLVLKTFCPTSGVTLKYTTNKAAEVSRLIQILGRLGRLMAGLPEAEGEGDVVMEDVGAEVVEEKEKEKEKSAAAGVGSGGKSAGGQAQTQGQGGKGKKKKGKK